MRRRRRKRKIKMTIKIMPAYICCTSGTLLSTLHLHRIRSSGRPGNLLFPSYRRETLGSGPAGSADSVSSTAAAFSPCSGWRLSRGTLDPISQEIRDLPMNLPDLCCCLPGVSCLGFWSQVPAGWDGHSFDKDVPRCAVLNARRKERRRGPVALSSMLYPLRLPFPDGRVLAARDDPSSHF